MLLRYYLPSAHLQHLVTVHAAVSGLSAPLLDTVPAMLPNLHIRLTGNASYQFENGQAIWAPPVAIVGGSDSAYRLQASQDLRMVIVGLLPLGWLSLIGDTASDYARTVVDAASFWPWRAVERLLDRLKPDQPDLLRVDILERFLAARLKDANYRQSRKVALIDDWLERPGHLDTHALSVRLDISSRQLQRTVMELYGVGPKTLELKYRSLRAAATLSAHGSCGLEQALARYSDQSHLIHNFSRFIGCTPSVFVRDRGRVAAATMEGRRNTGASRPLILLS